MGELLASMTPLEFRCWAAYRAKRGFALHESRDLLGRSAWMFACANRKADSNPPELGDFLISVRAAAVEADGRGFSWHDIKSLKVLR